MKAPPVFMARPKIVATDSRVSVPDRQFCEALERLDRALGDSTVITDGLQRQAHTAQPCNADMLSMPNLKPSDYKQHILFNCGTMVYQYTGRKDVARMSSFFACPTCFDRNIESPLAVRASQPFLRYHCSACNFEAHQRRFVDKVKLAS